MVQENEEVIDLFLQENPVMTRIKLGIAFPDLPPDVLSPEGDLRLWPHRHHCDGFYACLMEKNREE